ncbi:hypothetical protein ACS0QO_20210, partial [Deinococcus aquaticus]
MTTAPRPGRASPERREQVRAGVVAAAVHVALLTGLLLLRPQPLPPAAPPDLTTAPMEVVTLAPPAASTPLSTPAIPQAPAPAPTPRATTNPRQTPSQPETKPEAEAKAEPTPQPTPTPAATPDPAPT